MNPVYDMFNDIAQNMLMEENGETYMSNAVTLVGAKQEHQLSVNQAQLFLGIMEGTHPFLTNYNPLEFMLFSYQFQDKIKLNYLAVSYSIIYDHEDDSITVSGITKHPMTVKGHPDYVAGAIVPPEEFHTTIPDVGLYGQIALVNCIAAQTPEFAQVKGSFGASFIFEFANGKQSVAKYEPQPLEELGIEEPELKGVIQTELQKLLGSTPPQPDLVHNNPPGQNNEAPTVSYAEGGHVSTPREFG